MRLVDEDPPDLVEVEAEGQAHNSPDDGRSGLQPQMEDLSIAKVPLTIVTGTPYCNSIKDSKF